MVKAIVLKAIMGFLATGLVLSAHSFAAAEGLSDKTGRMTNEFQDEGRPAESAMINTGNGPGGERPSGRFDVTLPDEPPEIGFGGNGMGHFAGRTSSAQTMRPAKPAQKVRPAKSAQTMRPSDPAQKVRPADPAQTMRPAKPAQKVRPAKPEQTMRPAAPAQTMRPADPAQKMRPAKPASTMRPAGPAEH